MEALLRQMDTLSGDLDAWSEANTALHQFICDCAGMPLVITEVGYPSRMRAAADPWDYDAAGAAAPDLQARCYQAFVQTWQGDPGLIGVYFYMWWGDGGKADTGYTPRGKPALDVLSGWYAGRGAAAKAGAP